MAGSINRKASFSATTGLSTFGKALRLVGQVLLSTNETLGGLVLSGVLARMINIVDQVDQQEFRLGLRGNVGFIRKS